MTGQSSDDTLERELHSIYLAIQSAVHVGMKFKKAMMSEVLYACPKAWPVVGVTPAALDAFAASGFATITGIDVVRAHAVKRGEVYDQMLARPMEFEEWRTLWRETDRCVLSTKEENAHQSRFPDFFHPIDPADGLFVAGSYTSRFRKKVEGEFLRNLHARATQGAHLQ